MKMMKAIQVLSQGSPMTLTELPVPEPNEHQVLLRVEACGVCHGDSKIIEGAASEYPRIPGHEIVGIVEKVGSGNSRWKTGQRVGIGWHGGHGNTTALSMDGGYAEYMIAYEDGLIAIPEELAPEKVAPLLCAGETVFSALRNSNARIGDLVAISGVGGLGHLAIQYAKKSGFKTVALSRGSKKKSLACQLGAHHYIDTDIDDPAEALQKLGGAQTIIATAPDSKTITPLIKGLAPGGELIVVAVSDEPLGWSAMDFLRGVNTVRGTFTDIHEMERTVRFSVLTDVWPMVEVFPLERAREAYEKMMNSKVHFRAVLLMQNH